MRLTKRQLTKLADILERFTNNLDALLKKQQVELKDLIEEGQQQIRNLQLDSSRLDAIIRSNSHP